MTRKPVTGEMLRPQVTIPDHPITNAEGMGLGLTGEGESFAFLHTGGTWGRPAYCGRTRRRGRAPWS